MKAFSPIDYKFDKEAIYKDLMEMKIFDKSFLATVIYKDGRSKYDKAGVFDKYEDVTHYDEEGEIVKGDYNTFVTYNFTQCPDIPETADNSFTETEDGRKPVWHVYDLPWFWKSNTPKSIKEAVNNLGLSYITCVRLVGQTPPSKGIVHVDADYKDNLRYYKKGGVSITLNISDGGGHLQYLTPQGMQEVDESLYDCWHFNDALQHRTTEITSPRIQIRVFGRK